MKTSVILSSRAFETLQEAKDFISEEQPGFQRMVDTGQGIYFGGALYQIQPIRLGRYEDGS